MKNYITYITKLHEWNGKNARYVYFKEKIAGKRSRGEKKNNFYWLELSDLYLATEQEAIPAIYEERDYWFSAAEVSMGDFKKTPLIKKFFRYFMIK